jgi:hypothetical protein
VICEKLVVLFMEEHTMYKQNNVADSATFTVDELLSMFKTEAQSICKKPEDILSIAESTLSDFVECYSKYVRIV